MTIIQDEELDDVITEDSLEEVIEGDNTILDRAELTALAEVTGYLSIRYDASKCFDRTLIAPNPPTHGGYNGINKVIECVIDIMLYKIHSRIMPHNIPELRVKRYDNAINWLEKVSSGFIAPSLPIKPIEPSTPLRYGNSSTSENRYY